MVTMPAPLRAILPEDELLERFDCAVEGGMAMGMSRAQATQLARQRLQQATSLLLREQEPVQDEVGEVKAGRGRGYWAPHKGRPDEQGGSAPRDVVAQTVTPLPGESTIEWANDCEQATHDVFGLTSDGLQRTYTLPGLKAAIQVEQVSGYDFEEKNKRDRLEIGVTWTDALGNAVGKSQIKLFRDKTVALDYMAFEHFAKGKVDLPLTTVPGRGREIFRNQLQMLREAGYTKASLFCALTIGRYAWAKEGVNYLTNYYNHERYTAANYTGKRFAEWLINHNVPLPDGWPKPPSRTPGGEATESDWSALFDTERVYNEEISKHFAGMTAGDLARWRHPQGYRVKGADISPSEDYDRPWADGDVFDIGKAYMLDDKGHGPWDGEIDL